MPTLPVSPESFKTFGQTAPAAGEHRRVAQRVRAGFCFAQLLYQIEKVSRVVRFKRDDKLLIVQAKRICGVKFD